LAETAKAASVALDADESIPERILTAAFDVFMAHGFSGATTDMIQVQSGIAKSTIYRYFPSKEALFSASLELSTIDLLKVIKELDFNYVDIGSFLYKFSVIFLDILMSERGNNVSRLLIAESKRFPHLGKLFYRTGPKRVADVIETYLAHAHRGGEIHAPNPAIAAEHFMGMIRGDIYLRRMLGEKPPSKAQLERYSAITVETFLRAYRLPD
jgi:TetR/AcrR family transcriptional regulator, mexJK operon transcriptional repressor